MRPLGGVGWGRVGVAWGRSNYWLGRVRNVVTRSLGAHGVFACRRTPGDAARPLTQISKQLTSDKAESRRHTHAPLPTRAHGVEATLCSQTPSQLCNVLSRTSQGLHVSTHAGRGRRAASQTATRSECASATAHHTAQGAHQWHMHGTSGCRVVTDKGVRSSWRTSATQARL